MTLPFLLSIDDFAFSCAGVEFFLLSPLANAMKSFADLGCRVPPSELAAANCNVASGVFSV
jgi:hypothetical protein